MGGRVIWRYKIIDKVKRNYMIDFPKEVIAWNSFCYIHNHHTHLTALPPHHAPSLPYFNYTMGMGRYGLLSTGPILDSALH